MTQLHTQATPQVLIELLAEEYFGIGTTPIHGIATAWADLAEGRLAENIAEWGVTETQVIDCLNGFAKSNCILGSLRKMNYPDLYDQAHLF